MDILAIDPGQLQSGFVWLRAGKIAEAGVVHNGAMLAIVEAECADSGAVLAIETMQANYASTVGASVIDTLIWIGRFKQAWHSPDAVRLLSRQRIKDFVCGNVKAKDSGVRQALIDRLGEPGTKREPGPTYGVTSHAWAALAVAVTAAEQAA